MWNSSRDLRIQTFTGPNIIAGCNTLIGGIDVGWSKSPVEVPEA